MRTVNIILTGIGNVGTAFLKLIAQKEEFCLKHYDLDLKVSAVLRRGRALVSPQPEKPSNMLRKFGDKAADPWKTDFSLEDLIRVSPPGVLCECTPTDSRTGGAGLTYVRLALENGWNVVTANKGPLVVDFRGLMDLARQNKCALKISGATAAALPTLDVAQNSLKGTDILKFEGILNGTTNFILTQMTEGADYQDALQQARRKGIAETDPSQDVEGWDTAYKVLLLTNALFGAGKSLADVSVQGIESIDPVLIDRCRKEGKKLKLLGCMQKRGGERVLEVRLDALDRTHPLFFVDGTEKGITFETDTMSTITVIGGKSDPLGTAAAMLKDLINIYA